jgi:hypothetical protein
MGRGDAMTAAIGRLTWAFCDILCRCPGSSGSHTNSDTLVGTPFSSV